MYIYICICIHIYIYIHNIPIGSKCYKLRTEFSCVDSNWKFDLILQSKRLKEERILENCSRESDSQKGLGLNPK